jgi:hypothetical protein
VETRPDPFKRVHEAFYRKVNTMPITSSTSPALPAFNHTEFEARRQEAIRENSTWMVSTAEFVAAVNANVRDFPKAELRHGNFENLDASYLRFAKGFASLQHFTRCDLNNANFFGSQMTETVFENCNLFDVSFRNCDLTGAEFLNCNMKMLNIWGADLDRVEGLKVVSSVGSRGRLVYAYVYEGETRIQAGCRNATPDKMREAIDMTYGGFSEDNPDREDYLDAVLLLERWGEREMTRLASR